MSYDKIGARAIPCFSIFLLISTFPILQADDGVWQKLSTSPQPGARYNLPTTAVYASSINSMVFFGGFDFNQYLTDTWKLDFANLQWSPLTSRTPAPPAHFAEATVYDAAHDRMVLYGGVGAGGAVWEDLWAYEFGNQQWVELPQLSLKPGIRTSPSVIYNPRDTTMILFGGNDPYGNYFNDLWILDLNRIVWQQVAPGPGWPSPRMSAPVALDGQANTLWMFGGYYQGSEVNELWSLNLTNLQWTSHALGNPAPLARNGAPAFFDSASRSFVFFGGLNHDVGQNLNDLWAYSIDTHAWRQLNASGDIPSPRHGHLGAFAPALNRLAILGGRDYPSAAVFGDAFILNLNPLGSGCAAFRGDMNGDQNLTPADAVLLLNCVFLEQGRCDLCFADVSCNGILSAVDIVVLLDAVFLSAPINCSP